MPCSSTTPGAGRGAGRSGHCVRGAARSSTLRAVVTSPSGIEGAPGATPDPTEPEPGAGCDPGSAGLPPASGPEARHMAKRAGGPRSQDAPLPGSGIREPEAGRRTVLRRFVEDVTDKGLPVWCARTKVRPRGHVGTARCPRRPGGRAVHHAGGSAAELPRTRGKARCPRRRVRGPRVAPGGGPAALLPAPAAVDLYPSPGLP